jgi:dihydrofolate synthase/folylpolyglutamate synthase
MDSYQEAVDYLYKLQWFGQKLGLENIRSLVDRLNAPHRRYPSIHISGTNGKGSTAAILASILAEAEYRVGLYTSPHLSDFSERIRVNGIPIPEEAVARLTRLIAETTGPDSKITFFEFTTAMAFLYFAESGVDLAVIETGLGGRFDATNVIEPLVSIVTGVDYDHQQYLGETLAAIAAEKAGIIKPGVPALTAADREEALEVLEAVCRDRGSALYRFGRDFSVEGDAPESFAYRGMRNRWESLSLSLAGRHQLKNAACALAAAELVSDRGIPVTEDSIRRGLRSVRWEGRLEAIRIPGGPLFILDGAHNPAGAAALRDYLVDRISGRGGRLILVLGILKDKNIAGIAAPLVPLAQTVILTRPDYHRSASIEALREAVAPFGAPVVSKGSVREAVAEARSVAGPDDCVCVTGSLFTVGEARAALRHREVPSPLKG